MATNTYMQLQPATPYTDIVFQLREALFPNDPEIHKYRVNEQLIIMLGRLLKERSSPYEHAELIDKIERFAIPKPLIDYEALIRQQAATANPAYTEWAPIAQPTTWARPVGEAYPAAALTAIAEEQLFTTTRPVGIIGPVGEVWTDVGAANQRPNVTHQAVMERLRAEVVAANTGHVPYHAIRDRLIMQAAADQAFVAATTPLTADWQDEQDANRIALLAVDPPPPITPDDLPF